ncbi:MAG TPA: TIGR03435 family protein [Bryobacteraceae bacterium]|nr:TIGR03435 family protein [Bryobacteraceae bacterium]
MRTSKAMVLFPLVYLAAGYAAPSPEFEVATVRPSALEPQGQVQVGLHLDGAQVRIISWTLRDYIGLAYRMRVSQVLGPDWMHLERFDIAAKIPEGHKTDEFRQMLQALLRERFQLKFHKEQREFPVYALVQAKTPLKLTPAPPDPQAGDTPEPLDVAGGGSAAGVNVNLGHGSSWSFVPNRFEAKKLSMEVFAENLERFADRPIVDKTGLKGQFDFGFDINPEDYRPMLIRSAIAAGVLLPPQALRLLDGSSSASLSDALEKIGLRLEARKEPLDVIVVDSASKMPTEN